MNVLVVSAHPDDEIKGMGGTLKKISKYHRISILFLADGITARKRGGYVNSNDYETNANQRKKMQKEIEIRKNHARKALSILGIKS